MKSLVFLLDLVDLPLYLHKIGLRVKLIHEDMEATSGQPASLYTMVKKVDSWVQTWSRVYWKWPSLWTAFDVNEPRKTSENYGIWLSLETAD